MKKIYLVLLLIAAVDTACAQQNPIFTQYMFNPLVINPAYSGSNQALTLTSTLRYQWTGLKGAPQSQVFSVHAPWALSRSAAGAVLTHDQLGVTNLYNAYVTYAYRIPVSPNGRLAVGGQAGVTYFSANYTDLDIQTKSGSPDAAFAANDSRFLPNLGIGVYYYDRRTYVGLSLPTLVNNRWNNQDPLSQATQQRHYFLSAGHVFDLTPTLKLKPNILLRWVENGPLQYDVNANVLIQNTFWIGASYRMQDSVDGILQWNVNDQFSFGYSYGYPVTSIASVQSGTHEFVLSYRVRKNKNIVLSPRYF